MRVPMLLVMAVGFTGLVALSLTRGQDRPAAPPSPGTSPPAPAAVPDADKLPPLQKQMLLSARRGADWLFRMNGTKGRFLHGYVPALKTELEGDHFLRQAGAAFALARAARFLGEERYAARATQAVLTLLEETVTDPTDPQVRHTALPSLVVSRLGAAALLVLAVHELPAPRDDLLDRAEELCRYIRRQARPDGSLACGDGPVNGQPAAGEAEAGPHAGAALYALVRSYPRRPAPWKLDLVRKAAGHYHPWWKEHRTAAFVPWHSAACAEAYALTKDAALAEFVFVMNDWLCGLQYDRIDPRRLTWYGGFRGWADGRAIEAAPTVAAAEFAEALAAACRAARVAGDVTRHGRYTEALERALQFLVTLQYTDANTQHFADWYRPRLVGAFHASHQDGDLRIDHAQHAVSALVLYLEQAAR